MTGGRALTSRGVFVRNKWMSRIALSAALIIASLIKTDAASGVIDTTFGLDGTGRVLSTFVAEGTAIAIDRLGNIVVAGTQKVNGHFQIVVARYDPTGITLDLTFGNFGLESATSGPSIETMSRSQSRSTTPIASSSAEPRRAPTSTVRTFSSAGTLRRACSTSTSIRRHRLAGARDDIGGRDLARGMAVDSQGRIILVGSRFGDQEQGTLCSLGFCTPGDDIVALRVLLNGDPDGSFDDDGKVAIDLHDLDEATNVAIDQQDRVVIVGANLVDDHSAQARVIRFNVDGSRDDRFGIRGTKSFTFNGRNFSSASAVAIDRFGRIVVGGVAADDSSKRYVFSARSQFPVDRRLRAGAPQR